MMMSVTVLHSEDGPHPGWMDHFFASHSSLFWRLRTIADEQPRSHISPAVLRNGKWEYAPGGVKVFDGILTPQAAYEILHHIDCAQAFGEEVGADTARGELRKALGL